MTTRTTDATHEAIRNHYGEVARTDGACGCGPGCCGAGATRSEDLGYSGDELATLPAGADMGLGCGTPLAFANLRPGERVLDLGSGGGIDCFLAATQVGPSGRVIGVDMTPEMIQKARTNARTVGAENVEFRMAEIENLPVADRSVDAVVSNCVINLSPDRARVFAEIFRVLKPGGRVAISDIVTSAPLPEAVRNDPAALVGCIAGAPSVDEIQNHLTSAGFIKVSVAINEASRSFIKGWSAGSGVENFVASAAITAETPGAAGCCGSTADAPCC